VEAVDRGGIKVTKEYTLNVRINADDLAKLKFIAKSRYMADNLSATVRALIRECAQRDAGEEADE
jgi:hypothetical protein